MSWNKDAARLKSYGSALLLTTSLFGLVNCAPQPKGAKWGQGYPQWARAGFLRSVEGKLYGNDGVGTPSDTESQSRVPADAAPVCLKDRLNLEHLRRSISSRERQRGGTPPQAFFQGIDLSRLPAPQGNLVRFANGMWLPNGATINYSGCSDIPCAMNRIWGVPDDSLEGYLAYWWYLDMGYVLGTAKLIPQLNLSSDNEHTYRDYLFKRQELELFWRLSQLLPDAYRNIRSLQTMHRLASGIVPASWGASTCGDAGGTQTEGFIRLQDNCLRLSSTETLQQPRLTDFGYIGVTHEIGHRLDVSRAGSDRSRYYLSEQWELGFAPLSGWRLDQVVDSSTGMVTSGWRSGWRKEVASGAGGTSVESWVRDSTLDGFVRDYAGTSPVEDFADTTAYFRLNPRHTLERSPRKYQWISDQFYSGRKFDPESRNAHYRTASRAHVESRLAAITEQCITSPAAGLAQASRDVPELARSIGLSVDIPGERAADSKACLEARIHQEITVKLNEFRATEFEACEDLTVDVEPTLRRDIIVWAQGELPALIARQEALAPIVAAQTALRARLTRELDPREAYLMCRSNEQPSDCYLQSVRGAFDRLITEYQAVLGAEGVDREWQRYIIEWSIDSARQRLREIWERFVSGIDVDLAAEALQRWQSCASQTYRVTEVHPLLSREGAETLIAEHLTPFSGGADYVDLRLLECLNFQARASLSERVTQKLRSVGIQSVTPSAQDYLDQEFVLPVWVRVLDQKVAEQRVESQLQNRRRVEALSQALSQALVRRGSTFVGSATSVSQVSDACPGAIESELPLLESQVAALDVRLDRWSQLKAEAIRQACERVVRDSSVTGRVSENATRERASRREEWNQVTRDLRSRIRTAGETLARSCVSQNPGSRTSPRTQSRRRECVRSAWVVSVIQPTKEAWLATDAVRRLGFASTEVESWLRTNDSELQSATIDYLSRL